MPRRVGTGVDPKRLAMIVAVLGRHGGVPLGSADVFVNVAGGVRIDEPGADLAVALAIASAARGVPLRESVAAFGELGLTGRLRAAAQAERRLEECAKLGVERGRRPGGHDRARGRADASSQAATLRAGTRARRWSSRRRPRRRGPEPRSSSAIAARAGPRPAVRDSSGRMESHAGKSAPALFVSQAQTQTGRREGSSVFDVGDKVVYPHHGAGTVVSKDVKLVLGEKREYLTIKILHNEMTVNVPMDNAEKVGLRWVIDQEMVEVVVKVLARRLDRDAEELEPSLQAQPRQDEDRRHPRARRGRPQPRAARPREGSLDRREADVRQGEEDPRLRAHVREGHDRGRGARLARGGAREPGEGQAGRRPSRRRRRPRPRSDAPLAFPAAPEVPHERRRSS